MSITGVLIDPEKQRSDIVTIESKLEAYYDLLDCTTITVVQEKIGSTVYDIICDDEGMFKELVYISMFRAGFVPRLVGKLFICLHNDDGEEISLSNEQIAEVMTHTIGGALFV